MAKTHGSLTRAGKVKHQTPSVSSTDSTIMSKEKTGRAQLRCLSNKRFIASSVWNPQKKVNSIEVQEQVKAQRKAQAVLIAERKALK